ncbi:MAG: hypothetical protein LGB07_03500 [Sulfurovum sp.]|nr:hypothetical protein [Sulfurovum sp.]MCB4753480.1 hypothetical protein [Sulfurovum sp.]
MLYYYANTGHKVGLERVRRCMAVMKKFSKQDIEMQILVNDFRAGVAMKEEQGLKEYVTIETIQDIDAIATMGDSIIIDSNEDDHGRLVKYMSDFKQVWRFAHDYKDRSVHGETLLCSECGENAAIVDEYYFKHHPKKERVLLFLRDHDHQKILLSHDTFFQSLNMELLLGHYFFVKYEDELAKRFSVLHEPETYMELISQSSTLVTASSQAALEARVAGAKVVFLKLKEEIPLYPVELLYRYGVEIVTELNTNTLQTALKNATSERLTKLTPFDESELLKYF